MMPYCRGMPGQGSESGWVGDQKKGDGIGVFGGEIRKGDNQTNKTKGLWWEGHVSSIPYAEVRISREACSYKK